MIFQDRQDAGQKLAKVLSDYRERPDTIVLGLPRGGVVTAHNIASALHLPLDIIVTRKIGAPLNPEFAIGAIAEDGIGVFDDGIIKSSGISPRYLARTIEKEREEAQRRLKLYRGKRPPLDLSGKTVLLVDDGIATGANIRAAIASVKAKNAAKIVVAAPVAAPDTVQKIKPEVDDLKVLDIPAFFMAVGQFYHHFPQTTDEEVIALLKTPAITNSF